jgi:uncharacterized protein (TIGR02271 family)
MDLKGKLRKGMQILGIGDREYGRIDRFDDQYVYSGERRIPVTAFERMDGDRLYVGKSGARYFETDERMAAGATDERDIRVPVVEERLNVGKAPVEMGEVEIRKEVVAEQVNVPVELRREEVTVDRVDTPDRPLKAGDLDDAFQEGTIRVPVRGEEAVVQKEAIVTGEVVINREQTVDRQTISDTVRREEVDVDENYAHDRAAFEKHFAGRRSQLGARADTRKFEDAEPNYRYGYTAAADKRYAGRSFEDVEPDLRRGHTGGSWEELREEIREGWNRARRGR